MDRRPRSKWRCAHHGRPNRRRGWAVQLLGDSRTLATPCDTVNDMLTRLRVDGFKNLVGMDVRFGPFTCIAGANGIGKSNLFDAIRFLSLSANYSLLEAALRVRDEA